MRKLLIYGDSNVYGFDPAGHSGGRYPSDERWPDLLQAQLPQWNVSDYGMNGRTIPEHRYGYDMQKRMFVRAGRPDLFAVMLGSNDILQSLREDPFPIADEMENFLKFSQVYAEHILLLAPPPMRADNLWTDRSHAAMVPKVAGLYREIARRNGYFFADPADCAPDLAFDGVHFSPEGHRSMARFMAGVIQSLRLQ